MAHIASLRLTNFRSYPSLDIALSGVPVVLYGPNGAGKTNLLEAISFLSPGRGLRRAKMEDLARRSSEEVAAAWGINAQVDETRASVGQVPEYPKRRIVRLDGKNASGTQLAQLLTLMWLTPAQDRLFTGPASDRRKFMDRFSLVHAPSHGMASLRYEKARSERNRLLSDGITDRGWYDALEADMATQGAHVAQARAITVTRLIEEIELRAAAKEDDVFPKAIVALDGEAEKLYPRNTGRRAPARPTCGTDFAGRSQIRLAGAPCRKKYARRRLLHWRAKGTADRPDPRSCARAI